MKRSIAMSLVVLAQALMLTVGAFATTVESPHYDAASGFVCTTCHTTHQSLGSTGHNNVCLSCHRPGDPAAGGRVLTPGDAANPFGTYTTDSKNYTKNYQTSHRFDGSDTVPAAGAQSPIQSQMTTGNLRGRTAQALACVRCHNQHSNANGSFLRVPNDQDQLCTDCHRSRNTTDQTKGTHPVGVTYDGTKAGFKPIPANSANSTADLNNYLKKGKVSCSTCHGVHFTDSRSSTVDGSANFANLSSGDGNLLRVSPRGKTDADDNVCSTCHAGKKNHNLSLKGGKHAAQCIDCHGAHVEYDKDAIGSETTPNVYLVRRYLQYTTAGRISKRIIYNSTATKNFYNSNGGGVCQSCHNPPANHLSGASIEPGHTICTSCHNHNADKGSFSVGACGTCHYTGTSTPALASGSHTVHFAAISGTDPLVVCAKCHTFTGDAGLTHGNGIVDLTTNSCTACHGQGSPTWGALYVAPGSSFPYSANQCEKCHSATATVPFYSTAIPKNTDPANAKVGAHTAHLTAAHSLAAALNCSDCHGTVTSVNATNHLNGKTDFVFSDLAKTGGLTPSYLNGQCANTYCHGATLTSGGSNKTPSWTQTLSGCDTCHGYPPAGTHPNSTTCNSCHKHVNSNNDGFTVSGRVLHINGQIDVAAGSCDACHGYPPAPRNPAVAFGSVNTWPSARFEDYSGGGGAHLVAAHIPKNANPADAWVNCTVCHNSGVIGSTPNHKMTLPVSKNISNVTVAVDPQYRFADSLTIYSSAKLLNPPTRNITGNCSNISCHMSPSPRWSKER